MDGIHNNLGGGILMGVLLFIIGIILSAGGLYYGALAGMGLGEAIVIGMGIFFILWATFREAFKTKGFLRFLKGLFVFGIVVLLI